VVVAALLAVVLEAADAALLVATALEALVTAAVVAGAADVVAATLAVTLPDVPETPAAPPHAASNEAPASKPRLLRRRRRVTGKATVYPFRITA